jgi:hypothetical protein
VPCTQTPIRAITFSDSDAGIVFLHARPMAERQCRAFFKKRSTWRSDGGGAVVRGNLRASSPLNPLHLWVNRLALYKMVVFIGQPLHCGEPCNVFFCRPVAASCCS